MDFNLITVAICFIAILYIIYLEFKNPLKKRDIFIDIVISIILIIASIFQIYELDFNFKSYITWLYLVLVLLAIFYIIIVIMHNKKYLELQKHEQVEEKDENESLDIEDKTN